MPLLVCKFDSLVAWALGLKLHELKHGNTTKIVYKLLTKFSTNSFVVRAFSLCKTGSGFQYHFYSPALKKWGYTGFTMSFRRSVLPLFRQNFISTQYLENQFTESDQILYVH